MSDATFRVLAALRELANESEEVPTTKEIATRAALSVGDVERELNRLDAVEAARERDGDTERFEPEAISIEEVGRRVDTLDALDTDEHDALVDELRDGPVEPSNVLHEVPEARNAAERALSSHSGG